MAAEPGPAPVLPRAVPSPGEVAPGPVEVAYRVEVAVSWPLVMATGWVCFGRWAASMVTAALPATLTVALSAPHIWPCITGDRPGPGPAPTGTRPRRSGRAKVTRPSPPYMVPSREN